ncbi:tight junction protein ZO-1-like isoform X2 [Centruroides vittatus]|uniref:tight junction protein ZO-1-like isoform X2 n=1 Tax=Centruroides vittatus TaxID=120091 RepID=UPI0035100F15
MAGVINVRRLLERHKKDLAELNIAEVLSSLCQKGLFNEDDDKNLLKEVKKHHETDDFVNLVSKKGVNGFEQLCRTLETISPRLLTRFAVDSTELRQDVKNFDIDNEDDNQLRYSHSKNISSELDNKLCLESPEMDESKWNNKNCFSESFSEPVEEVGSERETWELHNITLTRVPGYGFGIAVSGGRDNPHFANGDPSIAISDVLKAGPAEGRLKINDRVITANGISLENVDYATAVQVLRECGSTVTLGIKRRIVLPPNSTEPQTMKVTLTKNKKKDDFGIVLACKIFVKEIANFSITEKDGAIQEGDVILKINNNNAENLTLKEAKKMIDNCKEKLELVIMRENGKSRIADEFEKWSSSNFYELPENKNIQDFPSPPPPPPPPPSQTGIDVSNSCAFRSNQNLYVQPPTRGDYRILSEHIEGKNNLTRVYGQNYDQSKDSSIGINPLNASEHKVIDQKHCVGTNELEFSRTIPRISDLHGRKEQSIDEALMRKKNLHLPDPRFISFRKDGNLGIRLSGGNDVGIFVAAVQTGSPAALQGLQLGDKILKVNDVDMRGVTREEAVHLLLSIHDDINLIVQYCKEEYEDVTANQKSDSFYIRTHFKYEGTSKGELNFHVGEVFHVIDTLYNGNSGSWVVYRLGRNNQQIQKGIIPNQSRAEEIAKSQQSQHRRDPSTESRGSFFKRRNARRSKSLSRDHWEELVFADCSTKFPPYVRVVLKHPGFIRPVILFGPMSDIARSKLLKDFPNTYASPQLDSNLDEYSGSHKHSGIIRLSAIKDIIDKGKHSLVDITPGAVDRLNYAQFYPIVIFLRADNKHIIKELRSRLIKTGQKSSRKLYEHGIKLEKLWSHIFTATIALTNNDMWYQKLQEVIEKQQQQSIWVSEVMPKEIITDDFLFPMTSRLSYASSPESDLDFNVDNRSISYQDQILSKFSCDSFMVKASSDPSIAAKENIDQLDNYNSPPSYTLSKPKSGQNSSQSPKMSESKDVLSSNHNSIPAEMLNDNTESIQQDCYPQGLQMNTDSYVKLTSNNRSEMRCDLDYDYYQLKPKAIFPHPPQINRENKPSHYRNTQERLLSCLDSRRCRNRSPDYINANIALESFSDNQNEQKKLSDDVAYVTEAYGKYTNYIPNHQEMNIVDRFNTATTTAPRITHDPYRFTRSTAQPARPATLDRKSIQAAYRSRQQADRTIPPSPPPKPVSHQSRLLDGRPIPPPKPTNYISRQIRSPENVNTVTLPRSPNATGSYNPNRNSLAVQSPYYCKSSINTDPSFGKSITFSNNPQNSFPINSSHQYLDNEECMNNNFDQIYECHPYSKSVDYVSTNTIPRTVNGRTPYNSIPISSNHYPLQLHHLSQPPPPPPPQIISNRESRGSAFELYRKPNSLVSGAASHLSSIEHSKYHVPMPNDNHNVVAMARGIFGQAGGKLTSDETGVSIMIPPGALPSPTEIYFKVCQDDNMLPPLDREKGETLLSPLVLCGPPGLKFGLPVELRLPHCVSIHPHNWSFALKSSDAPNGKPSEWQNISLDSKSEIDRSYIQDGYVSVLVDHF